MGTKKIILADDNEIFRRILEERISQEKELEVVKSVGNGLSLYEEIKKGYGDIVLLDTMMPILDGVSVLEKVQRENLPKKPNFIFLSGVHNARITERACSLGACYYLNKPFDLNILMYKLKTLDSDGCNILLEKEIEFVMRMLGISQKVNGYLYIRRAILLVLKNNGIMGSITKIIYPAIAEEYNTTDKNVERSIRSCIKKAYDENPNRYLYGLLELGKRPTNAELIWAIARELMNAL